VALHAADDEERDPRRQQDACLPLTLGNDARNGKAIEVSYHCSDVCPNQGGILVRYAGNISEEECCKHDGYPRHDFAFGGYLGCAPPETPRPVFNFRRPDGTMGLATRSPCKPSEVRFEDGTVVIDPNIRPKR